MTICCALAFWLPLFVQAFPAIDAMKPIIDNDRVVVWDSGAAAATPRPWPPVTGDSIEISVTPRPGAVVFRRKGAQGASRRPLPALARTIVVGLKDHPAPSAQNTSGYSNAFPRPRVRKVLENDRVVVWDYTWKPGEPTPMHFHDKDVVVVYLADGALQSTTPGGVTAVNEFSVGATRFNTRDRVHTEELLKGQQRAIIVELK